MSTFNSDDYTAEEYLEAIEVLQSRIANLEYDLLLSRRKINEIEEEVQGLVDLCSKSPDPAWLISHLHCSEFDSPEKQLLRQRLADRLIDAGGELADALIQTSLGGVH